MAVAAAGPVLGRLAPVGRGPVTAVLVVDDSASMTGTDGVASRFDHAKAAAAAALDDLPAGSAVAVLMASDTVSPLIPSPTRDLSLVRKLIAAADPTDRGTDLTPAIRAALDVLRPALDPKQLTLITDGQRSGWGNPADAAAVLRAAADVSAAGRPVRFEATVTNHGTDGRHQPARPLTVDADAAPSAEVVVDALPPGASRVLPLYAKLATPGPTPSRPPCPPTGCRSTTAGRSSFAPPAACGSC